MADSNLPVVNAIEELKSDGAKQRKALQDSLGRRFRILSSEVATLSQTLATSFQVQSDASQLNSELLTKLSYSADTQADVAERQLAFQREQATAAEFRDAENRAELARSLSNSQQQQTPSDSKKEEEKSKGIFGKLLGGLGGIVGGAGLGAGALLAGMGVLAAGGGFLLKEINNIDGKAIRENVGELIGIKDDFGGVGGFFLTGGAFALTMAGIGTGLAIFGAGSAIAGLADGLNNFLNPSWAKSISDNVVTLLGISDRVGGNLNFLFEGGAFVLAMTGLGIGLGVFGGGSAIAGLADGLTNFTNASWAQSISDNVVTLLGISDRVGGNLSFLVQGGAFGLAMTGLAIGLAVFGASSAVAGLADGLTNFTNATWAQSIVDNVATLLSITQLEGIGVDTTKFVAVMGGISAGLVAFSFGQAGSGVAEAINKFTGGGDFAERIKTQVGTLLSILDINDGNSLQKAKDFNATLGEISTGLVKFTGTKVFDSLAGIGTGLINFFTGNEAPMTQVLKFADNQAKLESASNSLSRITDALEKMSEINRIGIDFDIEDFSEELEDAVDNIADIDQATYDLFAKRMQQLREAITPTQLLTGAEIDVRSKEVASTQASPTVNVTAPQTNMSSDNSTNINRTTVASASPRRNARSPQSRDVYADPQAMVF
jgi:hypothetical protein